MTAEEYEHNKKFNHLVIYHQYFIEKVGDINFELFKYLFKSFKHLKSQILNTPIDHMIIPEIFEYYDNKFKKQSDQKSVH
jgi:hypothetical protein